MRPPPPYADLPKYPITGGTILLAAGVTAVSLGKWVDITPLTETVAIRQGEIWRLLTSVLPHANPMHLLFNLYWTWVFGTLIENVFGHLRTLLIFVLLAIISGGAEFALLQGGIGLSGVGYGLFGLAWVLSARDPRFAGAVDSKTVQLFVGWFFLCIVTTVTGLYPIANIAHGMGCVTGALLGWTIVSAPRIRIAGVTAIVFLIVASIAGATIARPWVNLCKFTGGDTAKYAGYEEAKLGYEALMANRNGEALRWYHDAVRMNPKQAGYWYNLGLTCDRLSRHDEAVAAFAKAGELAPDNAEFKKI